MLNVVVDKMTTEFNYLKEWIVGFLSAPQPLLNGFPPCPYAKKALVDNKVKCFKSSNYFNDICNMLDNWDNTYDVAICIVPDNTDETTFVKTVEEINNLYLPKGFVCLEDHKNISEDFFDLKFNNGKYNIILCQRTDKINQATMMLLDKGYYKNWSKEMYKNVVEWRLPTN
jgi:hypothetical protein